MKGDKYGCRAGGESVQYYKMISTVEYVGQGQFRNQVEELFTVKEKPLSGDKVQYFISAKDLFNELSFVVDRGAQQLSQVCESSAFWAQVNNDCVKSLKKVTSANIGKTWKQAFNLSSVGDSFPAELTFTLTAMQVENAGLGKVVAVRALSEPFFVKFPQGTAASRVNTVYLFDPAMENIFLSVSVFETTTTMSGFQETLLHEVATCKTDATGKPVVLKGLGKEFEKFVEKVGLTKGLKVVKATTLPQWAQTTGLQVAQAANICSALSCEGALNPVATISMPTAKVVELQKNPSELRTANAQLAANEGGGGGPWEWLVDKVGFWPAAGIVGGAIAIPIAAGGGGGGGGGGTVSP
ncbi:MAG: hypothetical protein NTX52_04325 [Planctomycetota bacterium]|nr:hypothetical protein [Planctomycetota bacterium]